MPAMATTRLSITLRPFAPAGDFPAVVALRNAIYPHNPTSVETARFHWNVFDAQRYHRERMVALTEDGRVVGAASFNHNPEMYDPDKYECGISVLPEVQGRGVGSRLWEWLAGRLNARGARVARGGVWENHPPAVAFAQRRGFREKRRVWQSILEVSAVDRAGLAPRQERVRAQGVILTTLAAELARDPECLPKLYTLASEAMRHTPLPDVPTQPPFAMFRQWIVEDPRRIPEAFFIARDGDRYVGVSFLERSDKPGMINQGLTATDPGYMGRGIAWALKGRTVQYAAEQGFRQIQTWNDSENQPMLSINLRLGFKPLPAWIIMEQEFVR
jgi:GNAT superfamily N-acetyltransferase